MSFSVTYSPSPGFYFKPWAREVSDYVQSMYWCFCCHFWMIFFSYIVSTLQRKWAVLQSGIFCISYRTGLAGTFFCMFIRYFLDHTQSSDYYQCGAGFKVAYFLSFNFQVFVFTYFIILFDWYVIIYWFWHINLKACFFFSFIIPTSGLLLFIFLSVWIGLVVECSPMDRETVVQSQVESYQRLKKWYLIPPCLSICIISYVSRVKWSNPGKGVALPDTSV